MRRMQEEFSHKQPSYDQMDATTAKLEKQHEEVKIYLSYSFIFFFSVQKSKMSSAQFSADGTWMCGMILLNFS
jgi:hypothetical protein